MSNSAPKPDLLLLWHTGLVSDDKTLRLPLSTQLSMLRPVSSNSADFSASCTSISFPSGDILELNFAQTSTCHTGVHVLFVFSVSDICHLRSSKNSSVNINSVFLPKLLAEIFLVHMMLRKSARCVSPYYLFWICHLECFPEQLCRMSKIQLCKNCIPT